MPVTFNCIACFGCFCACYDLSVLMIFARMEHNDEYTFHRLSTGEAQQLREELKQLAAAAYGSLSGTLTAGHARAMAENIVRNEGWDHLLGCATGFVCRHRGGIVGMAFLTPAGNPWRFFPAEWSYIRMVGVQPGYEGKGIGKTVTKMCVDLARVSGEKTVALHTSEFMPAARHIYESLGFTIHHEIEPQWGKRYWIYTLEL